MKFSASQETPQWVVTQLHHLLVLLLLFYSQASWLLPVSAASRRHRLKDTGNTHQPEFAFSPCLQCSGSFPCMYVWWHDLVIRWWHLSPSAHFGGTSLFYVAIGLDMSSPQICSFHRNTHFFPVGSKNGSSHWTVFTSMKKAYSHVVWWKEFFLSLLHQVQRTWFWASYLTLLSLKFLIYKWENNTHLKELLQRLRQYVSSTRHSVWHIRRMQPMLIASFKMVKNLPATWVTWVGSLGW